MKPNTGIRIIRMGYILVALLVVVSVVFDVGITGFHKDQSDWSSVGELQDWLAADVAPPVGDGECEITAFQARDRAYDAGKRLETEIMTKDECVLHWWYRAGGLDEQRYGDHMVNKAVVGNEVWFVQANTGEIWLAYYLDGVGK